MKVKFVNLGLQFESLRAEILKSIASVLESGDYILGKEVREFEKSFAEYCGTKYAIGVANGTDALFLSMIALGIKKGDGIITAPNSFISTVGAIVASGAKPIFVDVRDDYNIDPYKIEKAITRNTKGIIPIHLTGKPADMGPILDVAQKHNLYVIEDAAQAVGSIYKGKRVGSFGNTGCFSLHPLKNLNCYGDGGAITTNDQEIYEKLTKMRNHGLRNRDECDFFAYNSRLSSLQAAILNVRLKHIEKTKQRITEIILKYRKGLSDVVKVPTDKEYEKPFYHNFVIQTEKRDELQKYLYDQGIETKIHYPIPIHLQKASKKLGYKQGDFPVVERQAKTILSLPLYPELTNEQINLVIKGIKSFYSN